MNASPPADPALLSDWADSPVATAEPQRISRRTLLAGGAGLAAAGIGVAGLSRLLGSTHHLLPSSAGGMPARNLVVIEMAGGNDGLTMLVPFADPLYRQLRSHTAIEASTLLPMTAAVGLHPQLKRLHVRGIAAVLGVGSPRPDLSHFEMLRRIWVGDAEGSHNQTTGFLGRLCDEVGDSTAPVVGVSVGYGPTPALDAQRVTTAALPGLDESTLRPGDPDLAQLWRAAYVAMAHEDRVDAMRGAAALGNAGALRLGSIMTQLPAATTGLYPSGDTNPLAAQLAFAARLLAAGSGVRVVHVPMGADFDTHTDHLTRSAANMRLLDEAMAPFLDDLRARGLLQRTLVLTVSEFGRRAGDNGDLGLDHGTASAWLLAGAVKPGVIGAWPRLDQLDDDGNLKSALSFDELYASIAEKWFGVPASEVLPGSPRPIPGLVPA